MFGKLLGQVSVSWHGQKKVPRRLNLEVDILKKIFFLIKGEYWDNFLAKNGLSELTPEAINDKNEQIDNKKNITYMLQNT